MRAERRAWVAWMAFVWRNKKNGPFAARLSSQRSPTSTVRRTSYSNVGVGPFPEVNGA